MSDVEDAAQSLAYASEAIARAIRMNHQRFWPKGRDIEYYVRQTGGDVTVRLNPPQVVKPRG